MHPAETAGGGEIDGVITAVSGNSGTVEFATMYYSLADLGGQDTATIHYVMSEVIPAAAKIPGVTYDTSAYDVWVKLTDNGDGTYEERIADHCDPISLFTDQPDHIPTLTVKDDASYSTSANGRVEAVYLYSPVGDTYVSKSTTWEALATLPGGTYYVMLAVLLGGNCNPDAPQNFYRYEDFFRLVVDKPNNQNGVIYPSVQLHPLYQKYPEYFGLDGMKGVEVYVWQMAGNLYYCGALIGTNRLKTDEEILSLFDNGATMEEMRTILELCEIEREDVSIIPVQNPLSSYWYEIDIEYAKQINALFWGE